MKKVSQAQDSQDNVVAFPGAETHTRPVSMSYANDPLEDLLNEFSDFEFNDDFEDWEDFEVDEELFNDFVVETPADSSESLELLKAQIETLDDITKRLKYYVGEINTHRHRF